MAEVHGELSPESLRKIIAMAKEAPRALKTSVYKNIRAAAQPAAEAAKAAVMEAPPAKVGQGRDYIGRRRAPRSNRNYHSGLRENIAKGVKIGLGSGAYTMGVRITSSNRYLRPDQYRMNRTYDKPVFRHPVFGHGSAAQAGREWFYGPIESKRHEFEGGVAKAMDEAAERLAGL